MNLFISWRSILIKWIFFKLSRYSILRTF